MATFDWPELMAAGIGGLGLTPREFWALSPAELALMLGPGVTQGTMSRAGLEKLLTDYPDRQKEP